MDSGYKGVVTLYIYMGMLFFSKDNITADFGTIKMYYVGKKEQGYVEEGNKRIRKYIFLSNDKDKLNNITNAMDGSQAIEADTGKTYILLNNAWIQKKTNLTQNDIIQLLGSLTQINYKIINALPQTGEKGIIYLLPKFSNEENNNIYDEYMWINNAFQKIGDTATSYVLATQEENGLLSKEDKKIINELEQTYLKQTDIVVISQNNYENLPDSEKTAKYYLITN